MEIEDCRWTQMPNDFIDQGGIKLLGSKATCVYWCIMRKTKGWQNKRKDAISYTQLQNMTGFALTTLSKALVMLVKNRLIKQILKQGRTTTYSPIFTQPLQSVKGGTPVGGGVTPPVGGDTKETLKETSKINKNGDAVKVLEYVNEIANRSYQPTDGTLKQIRARLKEGYTELRLREVAWFIHDVKSKEDTFWRKNLTKYFKPSTLFNSEKFPNYLEELKDYQAARDD